MDNTVFDVVVVGGGVIGASSAFAAAEAGLSVALIDPEPGRGSSFAAAGMLAPGAESTPEHASLTAVSIEALALWDEFARRVSANSDTEVRAHRVGSLFVGWDAADRREISRYFDVAHSQDITSEDVSRGLSPELFAGVNPRVTDATFVAADAYVDADAVMDALITAASRLGATIITSRVNDCASDGSMVVATTDDTAVRGRCGIIATGYSDRALDVLAASSHKLRPVRGVTLRLRLPGSSATPMVRGLVEGRMVYVIRRSDGAVVVGASSDESPVEVVESSTVRRLLEDALRLVPELEDAQFEGARVGLRPASSDNVPFFDIIDDSGWSWSSGHFRHGFLLAPIAARDAVNFVMRRQA